MPRPIEHIAEQLAALARQLDAGEPRHDEIARTLAEHVRELQDAAMVLRRESALLRETTTATQADLERKLEEISLLRLIADVSGRVLASEDPFRPILDNLLQIGRADSASIFMLDEKTQRLEFVSAAGTLPTARGNRPSFAVGEGIAGRVAASGDAMLVHDIAETDDFARRDDTRVRIRSLVSFPLRVADTTIGVLNLSAAEPGMFSDETLRVLHIIAGQLSNVVQNARLLAAQRAQTALLRESERRYRELVENVNDGFFLLGAGGRTLLCNARLAQIFGRTESEILAAESWRLFLSPETGEQVLNAFRRIDEGRADVEEDLEFTVLQPDGAEVPAHMHCRTVDQDGRLVWIGMVRDMTAQKALQRQLLQSEKLASLGTLIAGTTHELNNKLAPIVGYAQLLLGMDLPEHVRTRLARIEEAADGAKGIVESLLGFSRDSEVRREPTQIAEALDRVLALSHSALLRESVTVIRDEAPDLPSILAARQQVEQVLLNLVNNAMHAVAGADEKAITVSTRLVGDGVAIEVRDTGCGIAPEHLHRIFDPFFTTKPVNQGTGLGLSLSYGIVRAHGGDIAVESHLGRGTIFRILLPLGAADAEATTTPDAEGTVTWDVRPRVLVVDDEAAVRELLVDVFEEIGDVETAATGREALAKIEDAAYDLVLLDIRMPDMDGMGLYNVLTREHPTIAGRTVFMTGDTYDPETRHFLDDCQRPYVSKPFNLNDVVATIRRQLSLSL